MRFSATVMHSKFISRSIAASLAGASLALAQTPPATNPSTSQNLAVSYGSIAVKPDILLAQNGRS
jgi:hypothetical protein